MDNYCKLSFVCSILILQFLDQILIHGVLYSREACLNSLFYVLNACNRHIFRAFYKIIKDHPRE